MRGKTQCRETARRCTVAHAAEKARSSCSAGPAAACCIRYIVRCKSNAVRVVLAAGGGGLEVTGARGAQAHATVLQRRAVRLTVDTARSDSYAPALQECHVRVCTRTRPAAGQAPRAARHGSAGLRARALVRAWVRGRGPEAMTLTQSVRVRHDQRILSHLSGAVPHARASLALPRTCGRRCSAVHADQ